MNNIIIDTNPLVYIYHGIPGYGREYAELLGGLSNKNILLIPKIVYGELAVLFQKPNDLSAFLSDTGIVELNRFAVVFHGLQSSLTIE